MASTSSTIKIVFDGTARGVIAAAGQASAAIRGLNVEQKNLEKVADATGSGLLKVGKGFAALSAAGSAAKVVAATAGAVQQLAPVALLLPGALLGGAAAMGTFKLATQGFGEAVGAGLTGDMEAFAEATKKMHPEMAKSAATLVAFKPRIDDLKKSVQGKFWDQFSVGLKETGTNLLDVAQKSLPQLSQELGNISKQAVNMLGKPAAVNDVREILDNTTETLRNMRPALANVLSGFLGIAGVGATYLPRLGTAITDVTAKFKAWVDRSVESGRLIELIDGAIAGLRDLGAIAGNVGSILGSVFRGLGGDISSPLASLRELTGQAAAFLKAVEAQEGLRALGETLRVVGDVVGRVVMTALRELMPTLVELAPVAQEVARTLGDLLVGALTTLGPIVRGVASVLGEFPGVVGFATVAVVGFVAAVKTAQAAAKVADFLGIGAAIDDVGKKADGAAGKVDGFGRRLGGLKAIAGGLALGAVAVAMNDINTAAAGGEQNLQGFEENLADIVGAGRELATLNFAGIFRDIDGELSAWKRNIQSGGSAFGEFLGSIKRQLAEPLPPLTIEANTEPGERQLATFIRAVNGNSPMVNINGNTNGAAFALRTILAEIAAGKGEVIIDGQPMPAQEALAFVVGLINNSNPEVLINGDPKPAGDALAGFLGRAANAQATAKLNADPALAYETVGGWTRAAEGTVGMAALDANKAPADGKVGEWVGGVSRTRGTATLDANPGAANTQLGGWKGRADTTTGRSTLDANRSLADGRVVEWRGAADRAVGTARLNANDSGARTTLSGLLRDWGSRVLTWTVRTIFGAAEGGPVLNGRAGGGPIRGPGTGTSDTAGLYALSNGEHVLTAREVAAAGGHAAIFALRRSLAGGRVPRMTATRGRAATGGTVTPAGALTMPTPQVSVAVRIGERDITDIVRTEISSSNRAVRREVGAGAGATW